MIVRREVIVELTVNRCDGKSFLPGASAGNMNAELEVIIDTCLSCQEWEKSSERRIFWFCAPELPTKIGISTHGPHRFVVSATAFSLEDL